VEVILSTSDHLFVFDLTQKPELILKQVDPNQEKLEGHTDSKRIDTLEVARKLTEFMEEGRTLLNTEADSEWWAAMVEAYIDETLGEFEALEWSKPYPLEAYPRGAVHRDRVDRTFTRLQRLGELVTRLRKD
jgi:hypothetical protein